jgi:hypothetical protein
MAVDLTTYSDDDLAALRTEVNNETVRRAQLRAMPEQIRQNATDYKAMGGDPADLIAAINAASETTTTKTDPAATRQDLGGRS